MIDFNHLNKKDSKKPEVIVVSKDKSPEYVSRFKQFIARKDGKSVVGKVIYTVYDIISGREVMKWTARHNVDNKVKEYIDVCYGTSKTIVTF